MATTACWQIITTAVLVMEAWNLIGEVTTCVSASLTTTIIGKVFWIFEFFKPIAQGFELALPWSAL